MEIETIETLLECAICLEPAKDPRALSCQHFFCYSCLEKTNQALFKCPVCQRDQVLDEKGVSSLPPAFFQKSLLEAIEKIKKTNEAMCCICDEDEFEVTTHYCVQCLGYLCEIHAIAHKKAKLTKAHNVSRKSELTKKKNTDSVKSAQQAQWYNQPSYQPYVNSQQMVSYPQQIPSYPQQMTSYPQQMTSYPQQMRPYPQQMPSYPQQQQPYPQQQQPYPQQQPQPYPHSQSTTYQPQLSSYQSQYYPPSPYSQQPPSQSYLQSSHSYLSGSTYPQQSSYSQIPQYYPPVTSLTQSSGSNQQQPSPSYPQASYPQASQSQSLSSVPQ